MKTKLLFFSLVLVAFSSICFAQTTKGTMMLGGTAGFDVQFIDAAETNPFTLDLQPQLGFFVADNIAVGGNIGLTYFKVSDVSTTSLAISPFGRYYLGSNNIKLFLHAQIGYLTGSTNFDGDKTSSNGYQLQFGPGLAFFLNQHVAIEGLFAYDKWGGDFDASNIGLRLGVQAFLGE
jgi:hypothetical protein